MIIKYPQELLDEADKRTAGRKLTGFTPGQGPMHPDLMLVGEAPVAMKSRLTFHFLVPRDRS